MKRIVLALLLFAAPAFAAPATLMVIDHRTQGWLETAANEDGSRTIRRTGNHYEQLMNMFGINHVYAGGNQMKGEDYRLGMWVPYRKANDLRDARQYDAVLLLGAGFGGARAGNDGSTDLYPRADSALFSSAYGGPRVPILVAMDDRWFWATAPTRYFDAPCCSIGVTTESTGNGTNGLFKAANGSIFEGHVYANAFRRPGSSPSVLPKGGLRPLLYGSGWNRLLRNPYGCSWCDSTYALYSGADVDQDMFMWELPMSHIAQAKRVVMSYDDGPGGTAVDTTGLLGLGFWDYASPEENNPVLKLIALARLDSLLGGRLINAAKLPITRAITIDGLCSRGATFGSHGIVAADTAAFYATLDSLNTLQVPIVFGVNADPDSMLTYKSDLIRAARVTMARFTPSILTGTVAAVAGNTNTSYGRPRDVLGRLRSRRAMGDGSYAGSDSSICSGLIRATALLDSALLSVGAPGRVERFLMAPEDDWSPFNLSLGRDSVEYAIAMAGYYGVRLRGGRWDASPASEISNPLGYQRESERKRSKFARTTLTMLRAQPEPIYGSYSQYVTWGEIFPPDSTVYVGLASHEMDVCWSTLFFKEDRDGEGNPYDHVAWGEAFNPGGVGDPYYGVVLSNQDMRFPPQKSYVLHFSCNEFAGRAGSSPSDPVAARPSYWVVKQLVNSFRVVNQFANRPLLRWGYPREVRIE